MKKVVKLLSIIILLCILLWVIRAIVPTQIDDVNPFMGCTQKELTQADIFYVVPYYKNISIAENKTWCQEIITMNKTLQIHGFRHTYKEFAKPIPQKEIEEAIKIFEDCFNQTPTKFKAPQLPIHSSNKQYIEQRNIKVVSYVNQLFSKVYHCNNTGKLSNALIRKI